MVLSASQTGLEILIKYISSGPLASKGTNIVCELACLHLKRIRQNLSDMPCGTSIKFCWKRKKSYKPSKRNLDLISIMAAASDPSFSFDYALDPSHSFSILITVDTLRFRSLLDCTLWLLTDPFLLLVFDYACSRILPLTLIMLGSSLSPSLISRQGTLSIASIDGLKALSRLRRSLTLSLSL